MRKQMSQLTRRNADKVTSKPIIRRENLSSNSVWA